MQENMAFSCCKDYRRQECEALASYRIASLEKAGMSQSAVDHYLFTQINKSVIEQVMEVLGEPLEKTTMVMDRYGYTGSGCIPMALHEAIQAGRIKKGDLVVLVASGAGLAVGASLLRI